MQVLWVLIENLADLDCNVQVNRYLANLYNQCYIQSKRDKIGPKGDPRCFNLACAQGDEELMVSALPKTDDQLLCLKYALLRRGDHELFDLIGSKVRKFNIDTSCIENAIRRSDLPSFRAIYAHLKYWRDQGGNPWKAFNRFLREAALEAAHYNRVEFFPEILSALKEREKLFPKIKPSDLCYQNKKVFMCAAKGALQSGQITNVVS